MFGPNLFKAVPSPTALLAPSGIVVAVNAAWRHLTGDDTAADVGGPVWRRFAPAERSGIAALVDRTRETVDDAVDGRPIVAGTQLRHVDGRCIDVALRLCATRDNGALLLLAQIEPLAVTERQTGRRSGHRPGTGDRSLALATIARSVGTGTSVRGMSEPVISAVARAMGCPLVGLWRRTSRQEAFVLLDGVGFGPGTRGTLVLDNDAGGLADHTMRSRGVVVIGGPNGTAARIPRALSERGVTSGVAVSLHGIAGSDGLLTVSATHNQPMDADDIRFLAIVGDLLTMGLQREAGNHLITCERRRTAEVAYDLERLERRHRLALAVADLRDWCWIRPTPVTTARRMEPPPRWSVQVCLDGGPQAIVDCAALEDVDAAAAAINAAFEDGDDLDITVRLCAIEGVVPVHLRGIIDRDDDGSVHRIAGLAAVASTSPPAQAAPPVDGWDRLAHTAHDLNNLLAAILGTVEQLAEHGGDRRRLTAIVHAARRSRELVAGLRPGQDTTHPLAGAYELADVVEQLRPLLHGMVGRDVRLIFQLGRGARTTHPARQEIERMLLDLVANSRDALTEDGTVVIASDTCIQMEHDDDPQAPPVGSWARLRVYDNGVGMSPSDRGRAFETGFTSKAGPGHLGLGLAGIRDTVVAAKGAINIDSAPGRGTVVDVYLPLATQQAARLEPLRPAALPRRTGATPHPAATVLEPIARTALIADDEPALRDLLCELLSRLGFEVTQAADGTSALARAQQLDRLDLLVSDLRMPRMDGLELGRRVRGIHTDVAIVLLSGAPSSIPVADRSMQVLHKPFQWNDLRDVVTRLTCDQGDAAAAALEASFPAVGGG